MVWTHSLFRKSQTFRTLVSSQLMSVPLIKYLYSIDTVRLLIMRLEIRPHDKWLERHDMGRNLTHREQGKRMHNRWPVHGKGDKLFKVVIQLHHFDAWSVSIERQHLWENEQTLTQIKESRWFSSTQSNDHQKAQFTHRLARIRIPHNNLTLLPGGNGKTNRKSGHSQDRNREYSWEQTKSKQESEFSPDHHSQSIWMPAPTQSTLLPCGDLGNAAGEEKGKQNHRTNIHWNTSSIWLLIKTIPRRLFNTERHVVGVPIFFLGTVRGWAKD